MINLIFILFLLLLIIIFLKLIIKRENFENTDRRCMSSDSCFGDYNHSIIYPKTSDCLEKCLIEHSRNIEYRIDSPKDKILDYSYENKEGDDRLIIDGVHEFDWESIKDTSSKLISKIGLISNKEDIKDGKFEGWEFVNSELTVNGKYIIVKKEPYVYDAITNLGPMWNNDDLEYITDIFILHVDNPDYFRDEKLISNENINSVEVLNDSIEDKNISHYKHNKSYLYPIYGLHDNNDPPILDLKLTNNTELSYSYELVKKKKFIKSDVTGNNCSKDSECKGSKCVSVKDNDSVIVLEDDDNFKACVDDSVNTNLGTFIKPLSLLKKKRDKYSRNVIDKEFVTNRKKPGYCFEYKDRNICNRDLRCTAEDSEDTEKILEKYREAESNPNNIRDENEYPICIDLQTNLLSGPCIVDKAKCKECYDNFYPNLETLNKIDSPVECP